MAMSASKAALRRPGTGTGKSVRWTEGGVAGVEVVVVAVCAVGDVIGAAPAGERSALADVDAVEDASSGSATSAR